MQSVLLLCIFACLLSLCFAQTCPEAGIVCFPSDCCSQYQQCVGSVFYPVQETAPGTVCKAGKLVLASECTTPCISTSTSTLSPNTKPVESTPHPTPRATTKPPSSSVQYRATQAPTQTPTQQAPAAAAIEKTSAECSLADVFTLADYKALFPHANGAAINGLENQHAIFNYTYLINAAQRFPSFACDGDLVTRKREVAAFLAHTSQETSGWWPGQAYNWGFYFSTEVGCTSNGCTQYCDSANAQYPCAPNKGYYGRGPMQLSWNYNYGQVSQYLYGNDVLLRNPDMMFEEGSTAFTTALWFWMTPQGAKPSSHDVMTGKWIPNQQDINAGRNSGFGMTTNIINGGLECGIQTPQKVLNRIGYYTTYAAYLGVAPGDNLECSSMRSF